MPYTYSVCIIANLCRLDLLGKGAQITDENAQNWSIASDISIMFASAIPEAAFPLGDY